MPGPNHTLPQPLCGAAAKQPTVKRGAQLIPLSPSQAVGLGHKHLNTMKLYLSSILLDVAQPYQLSFQDSATDIMEGILNLHNTILYYLVVIIVLVSWILINVLRKNQFSHSNLNHGTLIEILWTVTPALILINIALPSFKLLYMMDEVIDPIITVKTIGHQWYWEYEYSDYSSPSIKFDSYMIPTDS